MASRKHSKVRPATPGERFGANIVDWFVFYSLNAIMTAPALIFGESRSSVLLWFDGGLVVSFLGVFVIPLAIWGRTFGKSELSLRVRTVNSGQRLGFGRVLVRQSLWGIAPLWVPLAFINLAWSSVFIPGLSPLWGLLLIPVLTLGLTNLLWAYWDRPSRQALHDKVCRTDVVHASVR